MEKRYQVFVSSTYNDLKEERALVFQTLMEMDCFPAGMELFPAADEEQWEFIKKIIDDCDYYLLIIAGRYGSTITPAGLSYTEKEYDYAIEKGMTVLAFVHDEPGKLTVENSDIDDDLRARLLAFRDKVKKRRLVRFWKTGADLPGLVALSLTKTIKSHPAMGWVRANQVGSTELLSELNELRKRNQELERMVAEMTPVGAGGVPEDLAGIQDEIALHGSFFPAGSRTRYRWSHTLTWAEIYGLTAPYLLEKPSGTFVQRRIQESIFDKSGKVGTSPLIDDQDFQTIKVQFLALGLIKTEGGFWSLTNKGEAMLMSLRAVKASASS